MKQQKIKIFYATSPAAWRKWLTRNHRSEPAVWLVFYRKGHTKKSITWSEAVDVALCFGWIDSKKIKIDEVTAHQFFSPRKATSGWSKINKAKVERLIERGLMAEAGLQSIERARQNGSWTLLDEVEELIVPADLAGRLDAEPRAKEYFLALSPSRRKFLLQWVLMARRPETREKRLEEIVASANQHRLPGVVR